MAYSSATLEQLMQQAVGGDQQAYDMLLKQTIAFLAPFLKKRLPQGAEDVLQETLISIHKARHTYDGKRPYKPWVFAIARYRMHDYLRKHYTDPLQNSAELEEIKNSGLLFSDQIPLTYESIHKEISELPGKQPKILHLIHNDGYTAKEVAAQLGMKESAVKVAAHRAYKILRKKLG